ncbi:MAG: hypothetical protein Q8R92_16630, partial [Deltaproteobacteria bacterium]|nr:hypothetical protein [Deltaproteobacteria bacterium]
MKLKAMIVSLGLLAVTVLIGMTPAPATAQVDVTMGGSSASDNFNDNAIADMCGGLGNFVRKTRTGSSGNNCPAGTNASIRTYECNLTFCVGGARNGLACSSPLDTCPGGTCTDGPIAATIRISGFGSEFGVLPINGNCSDPSADFLCQNSRLRALDPGNCNISGGGNNDCACLDPLVGNAVTELDLGASDVQGGSFPTPVPQPGNSASPVAVPFKFIVSNTLTAGICNAPGNANNARNCKVDAGCGG